MKQPFQSTTVIQIVLNRAAETDASYRRTYVAANRRQRSLKHVLAIPETSRRQTQRPRNAKLTKRQHVRKRTRQTTTQVDKQKCDQPFPVQFSPAFIYPISRD